jgi:hypothetical protein
MAALRKIAVERRVKQGMLGPNYWNTCTSLLFGAGFRCPTSTRCSPATSSCTSSWYTITSKLYLVPRRGKVQRVGLCLHFARVLLAPSFYKHNNLCSGGQTHAHGMVGILLCGFIAQQCSEFASFKSRGAIYSQS